MAESLSDFLKVASELGMSKASALEWATKQYNDVMARDERAQERKFKQLQFEADEKEKARQHEMVMLERNVQLRELQNQNNSHISLLSQSLKLPQFSDSDDIAAYIIRFERIATLSLLPPTAWPIHLGSLLTGKALKIYTSLPPETVGNFDSLKTALLGGFAKTPDDLRSEFRNLRIGEDETYHQFHAQLSRLFSLWLEGSGINVTDPVALKDFIIKDQFLASLNPELRAHLKENEYNSVSEMICAADRLCSAHKFKIRPKNNVATNKFVDRSQAAKFDVPTKPEKRDSNYKITCFNCGKPGHISANCKEPKVKRNSTNYISTNLRYEDTIVNTPPQFLSSGTVNNKYVSTIMRDTGCSAILVADNLFDDVDISHCTKKTVSDYMGRLSEYPVVRCYIKCAFFDGYSDVICAPLFHCDVLIGNVPGASISSEFSDDVGSSLDVSITNDKVEDGEESNIDSCAVALTRARSKLSHIHPLVLPKLKSVDISPDEFARLQKNCSSLNAIHEQAISGEILTSGKRSYRFKIIDNLLYNICVNSQKESDINKATLVVPLECRNSVLKTAHEHLLSGHFSYRKTEKKIREHFFWPRMGLDIKLFCKSCDVCQRTCHKGRVRKAPLEKMPIISEPFYRVAIDLVGPLSPPSGAGHRYILTLIDCATSFPEAIPLVNIDSVSVAESLLQIFSRTGIPKEIMSDLGTQFTSELMKELHRLLGVKPLFNTPYHPMTTGRIERLHSTLKSSLKKLCAQKPRDWHRYLVPVLFSLREMPSDRTGYSAFELLYGRQVRGPLAVLRDLWENPTLDPENRTTFQYVLDLKQILHDSAEIAADNAENLSNKYKSYFDLKSQKRSFEIGDEVLLLLPDTNNKLLMSWRGPFKVLERRNNVDYLIDENGKSKLYHVNILKKYYRRNIVNCVNVEDSVNMSFPVSVVNIQQCVSVDERACPELPEIVAISSHDSQSQSIDVKLSKMDINSELSDTQLIELNDLIKNYDDIISDSPGCTPTIKHNIIVHDKNPIKSKFYPVPVHLRTEFDAELQSLLDLGIIRNSSSPYCSPCLMIKKDDGKYRLAIDYRGLNSVTQFDCEPINNLDEDLHKYEGCRYFTELDVCKAYYQIPMSEDSIPYTAFATPKGLMEFTRMPFGLVTACATYVRLMRRVLDGLNVTFYFDNILIYSKDFENPFVYFRASIL